MFIFSNLATSLDGKIAPANRALFHLGTPRDRRLMQKLRVQSDVVLWGASTLRAFRRPGIVYGPEARQVFQQPANAVLSSTLEGISPDWAFFKRGGFARILFVGPEAKPSTLRRFESRSEIVVLKKPSSRLSTAAQVVRALEARGLGRLLVEGGGSVMWDFCRENLIDEYYVTLTPWILGGATAPTLVDGEGFAPGEALKLRLKRLEKVGDELYLVYARRGRRS